MAEVSLANLRHNAGVLRRRAGHAELMAVVKADAYGHGAVRVARVLCGEGVRRFAVARVPEAVALREAGIEERILLFEAPLPDHLPAYAAYDLDVTVASPAGAKAVIGAAQAHGPLRVHVKVDTGMGRIGLAPEEAPAVIRRLRQAPGVALDGVWTHLATAGDPAERAFAREQLGRLRAVLDEIGEASVQVHAANSAALLDVEESFRSFEPTLVRLGVSLYGLAGSEALAQKADLRPVMRLVSRVTQVKTVEAGATISYGRTWRAERPTRIATVGVGYGDGYFRLLSNRAEVGIRGRRFPVAGTVCMDMTMVDLGPATGGGPGAQVEVGDEVVLFGAGGPSAFEVARWAETIPYEICCAVAARVPRRYTDEVR